MPLSGFHPIIVEWFRSRFSAPTEAQTQGWPSIAAGRHTLIAAPTGSGKTLAAFLACIDRLLVQSLAGALEDEVRVVCVSAVRGRAKGLNRTGDAPLFEINEQAQAMGFGPLNIRVGLRTGDTPAS